MTNLDALLIEIVIILFTVIVVNFLALFVMLFLSSIINAIQNIFFKKDIKPFYKPKKSIKYLIFLSFVVRLVIRNTFGDYFGGPLELSYFIDYLLEPILFLFTSGLYREFIKRNNAKTTSTTSTRICHICDSSLEIDDKFCPYCGSEIKKTGLLKKTLLSIKHSIYFKRWSYKKVLLIFVFTFALYTSAISLVTQKYLELDRNESAYSVLSLAPWISLINHDYYLYSKGLSLLEQQKIDEAYQIFVELDNYKGSNVLEKKIANYKNYLYLPSGIDRYKAFTRLGDFLDAKDKAAKQIPYVYDEALRLYNDLDVDTAYDSFVLIKDYLDSRYYVFAIDVLKRSRQDLLKLDLSTYLDELRAYDLFIDLGPIALNSTLISDYLNGKWYSFDGSTIEFNISEGTFHFSKFYLSSGSYYYHYEGLFNINKDNYSLLWDYVDMDTLKIHYNGNTYFYYRN